MKLTRLTDIVSPAPAHRAVFIGEGQVVDSWGFYVHYLYPQWRGSGAPPIHHAEGVTLSMADGHAEYWKWRSAETVRIPRRLFSARGLSMELLDKAHYEPQTKDGLYDLQRLQRATWGRLGYPEGGGP